jgi:hypothetical protein
MRSLLLIIGILLFSTGHAQMVVEGRTKTSRKIGIAIGSIRNRYPYPVTDLIIKAPVLTDRIGLYTRFRAYGIRSFANGHDYDLTAHMTYSWETKMGLITYAGAGTEIMLRFQNDDRSQATSGVQPMLVFGIKHLAMRSRIDIPFWTKFYANGFSVSILPEPAYQLTERFDIFLRPEVTFLAFYNGNGHEWRYDVMLGVHYNFK